MSSTKREREQRRKTLRPHLARDRILDAMRSYGKPISPTELADITGDTLGSIAYHVRTLTAAGIVELAEEARVRGAVEHFYALVPDVEQDNELVDPVKQLLKLCGALTVPDLDGGYPRPTDLDEHARDELQEIIDQFRPRVQQIARQSTKRVTV